MMRICAFKCGQNSSHRSRWKSASGQKSRSFNFALIVSLIVSQTNYQNYQKPQLIAKSIRKRGKIRLAKHSWFQPYEVFCRNTFAVPWPEVFVTWLYLNIHRKTFTVLLKTMKIAEVNPTNLSPFTVLYSQESSSKFKMFKILNTGKGSTQYISILLHKAIQFTCIQLHHRLSIPLYMWLCRAWQTITAYCIDSKIDLDLFTSTAVIWVSNLYNDMYLDTDIELV